MTHFELKFEYGVRWGSKANVLNMDIQLSQHRLLEIHAFLFGIELDFVNLIYTKKLSSKWFSFIWL